MQRERITITIDQDLLPAIDQLVDGNTLRNRSHAIEHAIRSGLTIPELTTVFVIQGNTELPLPELLKRLSVFPISKLYWVAPSAEFANAQALTAGIPQFLPGAHVELVPADFGDAAAMLLKQNELSTSCLIINLNELSTLPDSLLGSYSFHRQQNAPLTELVSANGASFKRAGIYFAQKELTETIPAGLASFEEHVFPSLLASGKVRIYVY